MDDAARERLDARERRHTDEIARANAAVAAAQDRSYWLDRWHLDLNALMRRRGAGELRAALRAARAIYRLVYDARRKLSGASGAVASARRVVEQERGLAQSATPNEDAVRRALAEAGVAPREGDAWVRLPPGATLEPGSLPSARRVVLEADGQPPGSVLAACTPEWRVSLYLQGDPDVYVLERR